VKADRSAISAAATRLDPALRLVLLHGADESASRDYAAKIARQFGDEANPLAVETIAAKDLDKDPQALVAAASAVSMFGDRTLIRIDDADDDTLPAISALLGGPGGGNPVVAVAGVLRKGSKLLTFVEAARDALAFASFAPEARDIGRVVEEVGAEFGLKPGRGVARALFEACGSDRAVLRREVEKMALYLDATPAEPKTFEAEDLAAIGADLGEAEVQALVTAIAGGDTVAADRLLALLSASGSPGIVLLRAVTRRFWQLLDLRQAVDGGASPSSAVEGARPPVFWKEKQQVATELAHWRTPMLRAALARLLGVERAIKRSGSAGDVLSSQALLGIAVQARRGQG